MLRAALIGFPSTGKTTLLRLLSRAGDPPGQTGGRQEAHVGVAQVPDPRLDRLTELFKPRRRVPATVEIAELAGHGGARSLIDVTAFRDADALLHVLRMFQDDTVPHVAGEIDAVRDATQMEDELILTDLGVAERRLERIRRDAKKGTSRELEEEARVIELCRTALEEGRPLRALSLDASDARRLRGYSFLSAKPVLVVLNLDEADVADPAGAIERAGISEFLSGAATEAVPVCAKIELEIAELAAEDRAVFLADLGLTDFRSRPGDQGKLSSPWVHLVFHHRQGRMSCLVGAAEHLCAGRSRSDPQRYRPRVHPSRGGPLRRPDRQRRLPRSLPRAWGSTVGRQGLRGSGRRRHQLPVRDVNQMRPGDRSRQVAPRSSAACESRPS